MKAKTVDSVLKGIVDCLNRRGTMTPAAIGKELKIHPKTAGRYVEAAEKLSMVACEPVKFGRNTVKLCRINSDYKEFIKKTRR